MSSFTATTVCCSFVKQYYEGLLWNPKSLPACYGPDSSLTSNEADRWDQPAATVTGSAEIAQALEGLSQALKQKQLRILGAEAIPSFEDSILIIVRGVILSRDCAQRYNHTFLLRQNGVEGEFYIRNDVWLYNEKEPLAAEQEVPQEHIPMAAESTIAVALGEPLPPAALSVTNSPARKTPSESSRRATPSTSALIPEQCPPPQPVQPAAEEHDERSATPEAAEVTPSSHSTPATTGAARPKDSPATQSPATPSPSSNASSGPRNWATLVKSAPNPTPAAATEKPQRVSPKPQPVSVPKEKEDPKLGASGSGAGGSQKALKDSRKREEPKCRVTMKIRSGAATDEAIKAALPPALVPHLVSLRNLSATKFVVFMDFSDPNALATLQEARVSVAGNPVLFELQKPRE